MNDPIVDEIRKYREAHAARFNYDLEAIYRDTKEREKEWEKKLGRKFVSYAAPPAELAPQSIRPALPLPSATPLPDGSPAADH